MELTFLYHSLQNIHVVLLRHAAERGELGLGDKLQELEQRKRTLWKTRHKFHPVKRSDSLFCCLVTLCLLCCVPSRALARINAAWITSTWSLLSNEKWISAAATTFVASLGQRCPRCRRPPQTTTATSACTFMRGQRGCPAPRLACAACSGWCDIMEELGVPPRPTVSPACDLLSP